MLALLSAPFLILALVVALLAMYAVCSVVVLGGIMLVFRAGELVDNLFSSKPGYTSSFVSCVCGVLHAHQPPAGCFTAECVSYVLATLAIIFSPILGCCLVAIGIVMALMASVAAALAGPKPSPIVVSS